MDVLLIGCGRIANAHADAIEASSDVRLRAVCDTDFAAAQAFAAARNVAAYHDLRAALSETVPDIAIVCAPPTTHCEVAIACLRAGVHVLCEKPLGISALEVEAMNAAARSAKRILAMAAKFRFMESARILKSRIAAEELGEILFCRISFLAPVTMNGRMNAHPALSGGGVVMDNGPHAFDLARFLLGEISEAYGEWLPPCQNLPVEDGAMITFAAREWPLLRGEIALSWSAHAATSHFVEVCGTRGAASLNWKEYNKNHAFGMQLANFVASARGECAAEVSPADALACAALIDGIYRTVQSDGKNSNSVQKDSFANLAIVT